MKFWTTSQGSTQHDQAFSSTLIALTRTSAVCIVFRMHFETQAVFMASQQRLQTFILAASKFQLNGRLKQLFREQEMSRNSSSLDYSKLHRKDYQGAANLMQAVEEEKTRDGFLHDNAD